MQSSVRNMVLWPSIEWYVMVIKAVHSQKMVFALEKKDKLMAKTLNPY